MSDAADDLIDDLEYELRARSDELLDITAQRDALQRFKDFVHKRLDDYGVPTDPDHEGTKAHGCRISGRLKWLYEAWKDQAAM